MFGTLQFYASTREKRLLKSNLILKIFSLRKWARKVLFNLIIWVVETFVFLIWVFSKFRISNRTISFIPELIYNLKKTFKAYTWKQQPNPNTKYLLPYEQCLIGDQSGPFFSPCSKKNHNNHTPRCTETEMKWNESCLGCKLFFGDLVTSSVHFCPSRWGGEVASAGCSVVCSDIYCSLLLVLLQQQRQLNQWSLTSICIYTQPMPECSTSIYMQDTPTQRHWVL